MNLLKLVMRRLQIVNSRYFTRDKFLYICNIICTNLNIVAALHDICHLQMSTELILAKAPFMRVVREIMHDEWERKTQKRDMWIQASAIGALQEVAEAAVIKEFESKII